MKRIGIIFLILAMIITSSGCSRFLTSDVDLENVSSEDTSYYVSDEAIEELVGYFEQSKETISDGLERMDEVSTDDDVSDEELIRTFLSKKIDIIEEVNTDLQSIEKKASTINGLDNKLKNIREQYFDVCVSGFDSISEAFNFVSTFFSLYENTLCSRPSYADYSAWEDFYTDLYEWYDSAKLKMDEMDCPTCLQSVWDNCVETFELNSAIIEKMYIALQCNDILRFQSVKNLCDRYNTSIDVKGANLLDRAAVQLDFASELIDFSDSILSETKEYSKLNQRDRETYEFENVATGKLYFDYENIDTIYPAIYNTYDSICYIEVGCFAGNKKIVVEAEIPGFTQKYTQTFDLEPSITTLSLKPPFVSENLDLTSAKEAQLNITISDSEGAVIESKTCPITIKSKYDVEWYSDEYGMATRDNILCFLDPESEEISELKRLAIEEISSITNGAANSFPGYQTLLGSTSDYAHYVDTYLQAAGIMRALYDMGVRYNADSYSISGSNQHVLFPDDVLNQKSGLCIETSLVVASALKSAGMHVFLIFPPGHAQVAVEVWNNGRGVGEYFLIETTCLNDSSNNQSIFVNGANNLLKGKKPTGMVTYYKSDEWQEYLAQTDYIIDCDDINILGMTPISN